MAARRRAANFKHVRALAALATVIGAELLSWGALRALGIARDTEGYTRFYRKQFRVGLQLGTLSPFAPHPYFGFQRDKTADGRVNNHGFLSTVDYPYRKKADEYVIGLLGGSVAEQLAEHMIEHDSLSELASRVPALHGKKIVVLNLSLPGAREPQQFFIASYFARMVDLLLNVDGIWETMSPDRRYPTDFPTGYHRLYGPGKPSAAERAILSGFRVTDRAILNLPLTFKPLSWSSTYCLASWLVSRAHAGATAWVMNRSESRPEGGPPYARIAGPERAAQVLENWERYTRLEARVAAAEGRRLAVILRPTERFEESGKSATEPLLYRATGDYVRRLNPSIDVRDARMRARAAEMNHEGLPVFDLADAFAGATEPPYVDTIDHLSKSGQELLSRRILDALARNWGRLRPPS